MFLWKYELRGTERKQWWPASGLRPEFPSKDIFTPFSNRLYVLQLGPIGIVKEILLIIIIRIYQLHSSLNVKFVKETSKNNAIISCSLGLSLVDLVMTVLNLRTVTAEQFLTSFCGNFINDWVKFDLYLFIVETFLLETYALFSTDSPLVTLELGSNLIGSSIREGMDVYFECIILANPWVYKVIWRHNVSLYENSF
jgi:hypothetical protein